MPDPFGSFAALYDQPDAASGVDPSKFYADWLAQQPRVPFPSQSALDTSGMGALTPPDTFVGRAAEAAMGDIRDPAQRQQSLDFAMGLVGPGAIKGVRGGVVPPETLNYKSAGAAPGEVPPTPLPTRAAVDRPPTAKELREAAQYDAMLAAGRARAEARKAAAVAAQPAPPGETLNYQSAGAGRGPSSAEPAAAEPRPMSPWEPRDPKYLNAKVAGADQSVTSSSMSGLPKELYHVVGPDYQVRSLYNRLGDKAYDAHAERWPESGNLGQEHAHKTFFYDNPADARSFADTFGGRILKVDPSKVEGLHLDKSEASGAWGGHPGFWATGEHVPEDALRPFGQTNKVGPPTAADISTKIRDAFDAAVRDNGGFGQTEIADLQRRSGIPLADLHEYLLREAKAGRVTLHPTTQAPIQIPEIMSAGITLPGFPEPFVSVRLK